MVLSEWKIKRIQQLRDQGLSVRKIAKQVHVSTDSVCKYSSGNHTSNPLGTRHKDIHIRGRTTTHVSSPYGETNQYQTEKQPSKTFQYTDGLRRTSYAVPSSDDRYTSDRFPYDSEDRKTRTWIYVGPVQNPIYIPPYIPLQVEEQTGSKPHSLPKSALEVILEYKLTQRKEHESIMLDRLDRNIKRLKQNIKRLEQENRKDDVLLKPVEKKDDEKKEPVHNDVKEIQALIIKNIEIKDKLSNLDEIRKNPCYSASQKSDAEKKYEALRANSDKLEDEIRDKIIDIKYGKCKRKYK